MGHQCYYFGVDGNKAKLAGDIIQKMVNDDPVTNYSGKVIFKQPMQKAPYMWEDENTPNYLDWKKNEVFFVIQGDRYNTNKIVEKCEDILLSLNVASRTVPLDILHFNLYMEEFRLHIEQNGYGQDFENEYVKITA